MDQFLLVSPWVSTLKGAAKGGPSLSVIERRTGADPRLQTFIILSLITGPLSFTFTKSITRVPVPVAGDVAANKHKHIGKVYAARIPSI